MTRLALLPRRARRAALVLLLVAAGGLRAEIPQALSEALDKLVREEGRWAYTITTTRPDEPEKGAHIERFDPSQPPDEAWTLLQFDGKPPSESRVKKWREKKIAQQKRREETPLGELIRFEEARPVEETDAVIVYEMPMNADPQKRFPPEKFRARAQVDKQLGAITRFWIASTEPFRMKGIARVSEAGLDVRFATVDPAYPPQPQVVHAEGRMKVLFLKLGGEAQLVWSDFKRVTPYADRFEVKIGEIKALDW